MKKSCLIVLALVSFSLLCSAQKISGVVKGTLQDSISGQPLVDATVSVMRLKDSSLLSFTITEKDGRFEIKSLDAGTYSLIASFTGLQTIKKPFTINTENTIADFGMIRLSRVYKTMDEVIIKDETPVKVKGDTLAYNADAFKTKPNANVEDLLKKLPGVSVDRDGTVKAQGEQVQKVYVDGKEFFSNDPKLATKNLTADMIDQVEVFDDMSEQAKFNKIDDGSRSKAINLKLKKDKKKGIFGKAYAGYGTDGREDEGLTTNFFKGPTQTSVIAKANNVNNLGFTSSDMIGMYSGGSSGGFGGGKQMIRLGGLNTGSTGSGITTSSQAGINYRDTWSKHFDVNGSYFFNHAQTENFQKILRQTFATDTTYINDQQSNSVTSNNNHRFNLNMIYTIDSLNSIIFSPNISFQKSRNNSDDTTSYNYNTHNTIQKLNESRSVSNNSGDGNNWTNNLIWRRKFNKLGRTLSVSLVNTLTNSERESYSIINAIINSRNYYSNTNSWTNNYGATFSYTEPLTKNKVLELNYSFNKNKSESDKETFNYNTASSKYDELNDSLTNHFRNLSESQRVGTNFRVVEKKYNYQFGVAAQQTILESNNLSKGNLQSQKFTNFFPTAIFNYQFARSKSLRFNYRGRTNQPSISQLQDVLEVGNYPYLSKGNPLLKQEFSNNFILNYNSFNVTNFRNFFAFISYSNTYNKIVNSVTINPDGTQLTVPVNINGSYAISGDINFGLPIKKMKGGNFNTTTRISLTDNPGLYKGVKNYTSNLTAGEDLRLNYNYKEKLDMGLTASVNYNSVHYTTQLNKDQSYYTHAYSADINCIFPKGFILSSDFDYTFYTGRTDGYNQSYAMWNGSFAKQLFRNKHGELKASVYDILNQNVSVSRNVGQNYIEDVRNSTLQRFFMLSFIYYLNRMGGKGTQQQLNGGKRNFRMAQ